MSQHHTILCNNPSMMMKHNISQKGVLGGTQQVLDEGNIKNKDTQLPEILSVLQCGQTSKS